ncbi:10938_t:CDS:2, partial [Dentiscutata heterogama]
MENRTLLWSAYFFSRVVCVKNWQTPSYTQHLVAIAPMLCIDIFPNFWICWFSLTNINGIWHNDSNTNPGRPVTTSHFGYISNLYQIALFDKHDKLINYYITVDENDQNLIKKHKWYLTNEIVVNENGVALTEFLINDSINDDDKSIFKVVNKDYSIQESQIYALIIEIENFSIFDKPLNIFT